MPALPSPRHHRSRVCLGACAALLTPVLVAATPSPASAAAPPPRIELAGSTPSWALPANAVGTPSPGEMMSFQVALPLRDAGAAETLLQQVSTPGSATYGQYLTPAQFNARFGPQAETVDQVTRSLAAAGLTVTGVADGQRWVTATGTAAQVDAAFATTLRTYRHGGQEVMAPSSPLMLPGELAGKVLAVSGLTQSVARSAAVRPVDTAGDTPAAASACSAYWGQYRQDMPAAYGETRFPTYLCGYRPAQLRSAYGLAEAVDDGRDGRRTRVAVIDAYASPTMLSDANAYAAAVGDRGFAPGQYSEHLFTPFVNQDICGDWSVEETLDIEAVHAMAPGAQVLYFGGSDCVTGLASAANYIVQHHAADIVSNSYSWATEELPPASIQLEHSIYLQGALEGIGFYFASGDWGDNSAVDGVNAPEPGYEASDPLVTAVGGTSLAVGARGGYLFETGWGSALDRVDATGTQPVYREPLPGTFVFGAGGGVSTLFRQPFYQAGRVPARLAAARGNGPMRVVPDIAAVADPYTGFAIGQTVDGVFRLSAIGGTSLACPLVAGMQADASTGRRVPIGLANPLLYSAGRAALRDVVPPREPVAAASPGGTYLVTFDQDTTLATTRGYDQVTGLGTPLGAALVRGQL